MSDNYTALIDRLVALRKARGLSQTALAAAIGYSRPHLCRLEAHEGNPTLETVCRIADALNATITVEPRKSV